jgi:hypothetical protein
MPTMHTLGAGSVAFRSAQIAKLCSNTLGIKVHVDSKAIILDCGLIEAPFALV